LKIARGSALSAASTVASGEKCKKNGVERQPGGLQVWNKILMLRLSRWISG